MSNARFSVGAAMLALVSSVTVMAYEVPFHTTGESLGTMDGAAAVAVADFDRDGDLDVVAAALVADLIRVWVNDLPGAWVPIDIRTGFDQAISVAAADINHDGWTDVVVCQRGGDGSVDWLENPGGVLTITWTVHPVADDLDGARWVHAADLDGDGDVDLLGARLGAPDSLRWYENVNGTGVVWDSWNLFEEPTFDGPHFVTTADMDGDGDLDAVAAAYYSDAVAWFENDGSIAGNTDWAMHGIGTGIDQVVAVHAVDLDSDGDVDVLAAGYGTDEMVVYWNEGTGFDPDVYTVSHSFGEPYSITTADLNQDARLDVVAVGREPGYVTWWEQDYSGLEGPYRTGYAYLRGARSVVPGDFDRDGDLDLVVATEVDDEVVWIENERIHHRFYNNGASTGSATMAAATALAVGDLDGDGRPDPAVTSSNDTSDPDIEFWTDANMHNSVVVETEFDDTRDLSLADINRDGRLDVVAVSSVTNTIAWWENGASGFTRHDIATGVVGPVAVDTGDINNDGDIDVVAASPFLGRVYLFRNSGGTGTVWSSSNWSGHADVGSVRMVDLDGNGTNDILFGAVGSSDVGWIDQDPVATFTERVIDPSFHAAAVAAADVNGDGSLDVIGADSQDDMVSTWLNSGDPNPTWTRVDVATGFDGASDVKGADLDVDGDVDLFGCAYDSGRFSWFENTDGAGTFVENVLVNRHSTLRAMTYDRDRDGLTDLAVLTQRTSPIVWEGMMGLPNQGGQIWTERRAWWPAFLAPGAAAAVITVEVTNQGKPWDRSAELKNLILSWYDGDLHPLDYSQVNALFSLVSLYQETDGEWGWKPLSDTLLASVYPIPVDYYDKATITLPSTLPNPEIPPGLPVVYYVVMQQSAGAASQPVQRWSMDMYFNARSYHDSYAFNYRSFDSPLITSPSYHLSTGYVTVWPADLLFFDQFESGDTSAWTSTVAN